MTERSKLENNNILKRNERPLFKRFIYNNINDNLSPSINEQNKTIRDKIAEQIIHQHKIMVPLSDAITEQQDSDLLISELDRYGLPLRTVINLKTGLIRSDPYYTEEFLSDFYSNHYRSLYTNTHNYSYTSILTEQINRGESYFNFCKDYLKKSDSILEIGCGMGGILIPFKLRGFKIKGIDLGEEFIEIGKRLNLNLLREEVSTLIDKKETYDFIILSHLIEHIPNINEFLTKVKYLLKDKGKIFIAVPGVKMIHHTYQNNLGIYLQNAHCWSFSETTLKNLLLKNKFKPVKSDEYINCLAFKDEAVESDVNLEKEADKIVSYLTNIEKHYLYSQKKENSTLTKILRVIKNGIKRI